MSQTDPPACLSRAAGVVVCVASCWLPLLVGCGRTARLHQAYVPAGSLRLAEVTAVATRRQVTEAKPLMDILAQSNVGDADVRDGCVALARIYCCGGPSEEDTAVMVYVPDDVAPARAGDVVELRVGRPASGGKAPRLNTVTRVRQRRGEAAGVRWVPEDDRMWTRVLYADWMRAEGWVEQGGLWHAWYKPPGK